MKWTDVYQYLSFNHNGRLAVVIMEKATGYCTAYFKDIEGITASGKDFDEAQKNLIEAYKAEIDE